MWQAHRTRIALLVSLIIALGVASPASAVTPEAAEINALVREVDALYAQGRYLEASARTERILKLAEQILGPDDSFTLTAVNNLAEIYRKQGRYNEAEPLYRRVVDVFQRLNGPEHPDTLAVISNLAELYQDQGRPDEAEPLYRRVLEGSERVLGKEHPATLTSLNNLATLYRSQRRYEEAEPLFRRAFEASERVLGANHPDTLISLNNLAALYHGQHRYEEALPLYRRALEARESTLGEEHPDTLTTLNNLAKLYEDDGRYREAEPLYSRVAEAAERILGKEHPRTLAVIGNLGKLHFEQQHWADAANFWGRGTTALIERSRRGLLDMGLSGRIQTDAEQWSWQFWGRIKAVYRQSRASGEDSAASARAMFQTAQWALGSEAARSLGQMAARGATDDPTLSALARERQDLVVEWRLRDGFRNGALGEAPDQRNVKIEGANSARIAAIEGSIAGIDTRLTAEFPDYAALASPTPLSVEDTQAQLGADEALVLFLDIDARFTPTPEETFIWVVTKTDVRWLRSDLGTEAATKAVQTLRCGLDEEEWATPSNAQRCATLLGLTQAPEASQPLPFDLGQAYALYKGLFGGAEDLIKGKRLIIVPSGPLTSLPFHVLVTKQPAINLPDKFEGYRDAAWLGNENAIVTLPAVASLKALRQHALNREAASDAYAGYGNPRLTGDGGSCRVATSPEACSVVAQQNDPNAAPTKASGDSGRATVRGSGGRRSGNATTDDVFAKGSTPEALLTQVRGLCPLPDTEYEIKCVARRFAANASLIRLAGEATETDIKALSKSGKLAQYRVLHFATHGLLSGDVERMAQRQGEPALVLTPPDKPADADDDGLLTASEIAALRLNADWVVMSACNTAAGDKIGAQALSGLARAFFYAGGRTLLVSHWPVYSDAAVRLTTGAFAELERDPKAGRAEALQRAMIDLLADPSKADNAHPAVWAPFVVVGEGGR